MTRAARGFCQASLPCLLLAAAASCSQGGNAPQDNANQTPDSAVEVQPDAGQVQPDAQVTDMCDPEPIQVGVEQSAPAWASAQLAATAAFESALDSFYEKFVEPSTGCLMNPGFSWYNWDDVLEGPAVHSKFLSIAGRQDQRETHALIYKCYHQRAINDGFFDPDDAFYIPHYDAEHQMEGLMHLWSAVDLGPEDPELAEIVLQQSEWLISSEATHESGVFRASRLGVGGLSVQGADVLYNLGFVSPVIRAWMLTGDERFRQWVLDYTGAWASAALTEPEEFQGILPCQIDSETLEPGPFSDGNWWSCVGTNLDGWDWSQYGIAAIGRSTHGAIWGERLADARSMKLAEAMRTTLERFLHATTPPSDGYCPETGTFCRIAPRYLPRQVGELHSLVQSSETRALVDHYVEVRDTSDDSDEKAKVDYLSFSFQRGHDASLPEGIFAGVTGYLDTRVQCIQDLCETDGQMPSTGDEVASYSLKYEGLDFVDGSFAGKRNRGDGAPSSAPVRYYHGDGTMGLPAGVTALVRHQTEKTVELWLYNSNETATSVSVVGGFYGQNKILSVKEDGGIEKRCVGCRRTTLVVAAGSLARLELEVERFALEPTLTPWALQEAE